MSVHGAIRSTTPQGVGHYNVRRRNPGADHGPNGMAAVNERGIVVPPPGPPTRMFRGLWSGASMRFCQKEMVEEVPRLLYFIAQAEWTSFWRALLNLHQRDYGEPSAHT